MSTVEQTGTGGNGFVGLWLPGAWKLPPSENAAPLVLEGGCRQHFNFWIDNRDGQHARCVAAAETLAGSTRRIAANATGSDQAEPPRTSAAEQRSLKREMRYRYHRRGCRRHFERRQVP